MYVVTYSLFLFFFTACASMYTPTYPYICGYLPCVDSHRSIYLSLYISAMHVYTHICMNMYVYDLHMCGVCLCGTKNASYSIKAKEVENSRNPAGRGALPFGPSPKAEGRR
ncbi:hypothetical protein CSUI_009761 [Cystoisospora suis]|uniref:Transmembrane protein n=1 Tax=Cystoisospora suis TaxID=483139 RepID=A0A2C6KFW7_9APIC|nr:hypothetical protein CSUI_009761 [Cystoisospora suis]